ncbi:MAG TPA: hypothetical protein VGX25_02180 [Actinophytocola sp.]|uniref:hypothetical protein n=1 Tax=Actinophytocola sp. TaxID=1872138 RepID=UPI002DDD356C|nr:hypothetical protein [Actinophytocola sp.]HEV2778187.1 hypothetical protein [Actinophytocola sp.]
MRRTLAALTVAAAGPGLLPTGPAAATTTGSTARAFLAPTMYRCFTGGYRPAEFNPRAELVGRVERGDASDRIIATVRDAQSTVTRTGPLVPPTRDATDRAGGHLYAIPGPVAR